MHIILKSKSALLNDVFIFASWASTKYEWAKKCIIALQTSSRPGKTENVMFATLVKFSLISRRKKVILFSSYNDNIIEQSPDLIQYVS